MSAARVGGSELPGPTCFTRVGQEHSQHCVCLPAGPAAAIKLAGPRRRKSGRNGKTEAAEYGVQVRPVLATQRTAYNLALSLPRFLGAHSRLLSLSLSLSLSISISISSSRSLDLSISLCPSVCLSLCLSFCLSLCLPTCPPAHLPTCPPARSPLLTAHHSLLAHTPLTPPTTHD